jgi:DNA primase
VSNWIDFRELRQQLDFETVLRAYGVELRVRKASGDRQVQCFCPLPTCVKGKGNSPSFSANLDKGIWQCFSCGAKGNVIDFGVRMENLDPENPRDFRRGALRLHRRFIQGRGEEEPRQRKEKKRPEKPVEHSTSETIVNAPLDFELKGVEPDHPYLKGRGYSKETIRHFGLGYCARGLMQGRIAIPLHTDEGLIGYAGRLVDDSAVDEDKPRYLFPSGRERGGIIHEFRKSEFIYNGFRIEEPVHNLIVVESFTAVWWLFQHGYPNVVSVMGSSCAERQAELIVALCRDEGRLWLLPDGDEAGRLCAASLLNLLSPHRFVRWIKLHDDMQPTDLKKVELEQILGAGNEDNTSGGDYAE